MRNNTLEKAAAWCGLVYLFVFGGGWLVLAHFFPPISPNDSALEVAAIFKERQLPLMFASILMMLSTLILIPSSALLVLIVQKIEKKTGMLTIMIGFTLGTNLILNFYTPLSFSAAAFRPDRNPEAIQLISDLGFLQFMGGIPLFIGIWFISAFAILVTSPRENPIIPRWFGYLNLWIGILYIPELLIYFFKVGPFAWDGFVGFWIPMVLFVIYFCATPIVLVPAVKRHFND